MKFSFESQQYRNEVAKELGETERSERKVLLEKKKKTLKFVLAEHIREFNRKNDRRRKASSAENLGTQDDGVGNKVVIEIKDHWRDESTNIHVEVETIDISDQIPESVKIFYDMKLNICGFAMMYFMSIFIHTF